MRKEKRYYRIYDDSSEMNKDINQCIEEKVKIIAVGSFQNTLNKEQWYLIYEL